MFAPLKHLKYTFAPSTFFLNLSLPIVLKMGTFNQIHMRQKKSHIRPGVERCIYKIYNHISFFTNVRTDIRVCIRLPTFMFYNINLLMPDGNKKVTHTSRNLPLKAAGLLNYV